MGKLRWYKRDPDAALAGMMVLTLEERGAYNTVLDLIYARDGAVDDDPRFIAGWLRCDVRIWKRIRARLVELEKLYVADGMLRNCRADAEVDKGLKRIASASDAGKASARSKSDVKNENKGLTSTDAQPTFQLSTTTSTTTPTEKKECLSEQGSDTRKSKRFEYPKEFEDQFWKPYPTDPNMSKKEAFVAWKRLSPDDRELASKAIPAFRRYCEADPKYRPVHACRFLSQRRFEGFATPSAANSLAGLSPEERARKVREEMEAENAAHAA